MHLQGAEANALPASSAMSAPPTTSRFQQRKEMKAQMYATSNERETEGVMSRRQVSSQASYVPRAGSDWKGAAWGLSSTKVGGAQKKTKGDYIP